jgi:hypothetical protein
MNRAAHLTCGRDTSGKRQVCFLFTVYRSLFTDLALKRVARTWLKLIPKMMPPKKTQYSEVKCSSKDEIRHFLLPLHPI